MNDLKHTISICLTIVTVVAIVVGGSLSYCNSLDRMYYEAVRACTERGGTWVDRWSSNGICVQPRSATAL